jgi:hypothetical protein
MSSQEVEEKLQVLLLVVAHHGFPLEAMAVMAFQERAQAAEEQLQTLLATSHSLHLAEESFPAAAM